MKGWPRKRLRSAKEELMKSAAKYGKSLYGEHLRYAIDPTKIHNELGWLPET